MKDFVLKRIDYGIIISVLFLYITPIIGNDFFLTQDGPSHVYNTYVLKNLMFESSDILNSYYDYQIKNSPNWVVNILYIGLLSVFSQTLSYKIVHLLICLLLPTSIIYLIRTINKENVFLVLFSIPFVYTLSFVIGFNNFCLGLSLAIFCFGYWLRQQNKPSWKSSLLLFIFSIVLYYTHLVAICIFLLLMFIHVLSSFKLHNGIKEGLIGLKSQIHEKKILLKVLPFTLVLILIATQFISSSSSNDDIASLSKLWKMRNMNVFYTSKEEFYAKILSITLFSLTIVSFFLRKKSSKLSIAFWVSTVALLFLYLYAPDTMAGGSFVSHRLELIFFIFLIVALATTSFPKWSKVILIPLSLYICWGFYKERVVYFKSMSEELKQFSLVAEKIEDHSTLLYLCHNASGISESGGYVSPGMGMFHHADCFVAMEKNDIVILKNYETHYDYFPIKWKPEKSPHSFLACEPYSMNYEPPCVNIENYNKENHQVDYILVYKKPNEPNKSENELKAEAYIAEYYDQLSASPLGTITLYKKKS